MTVPRVVVVIPCYNEAARLRPEEVLELRRDADCDILLVDDGSTDGTREVLATFDDPRIRVLLQPHNPVSYTHLTLPTNREV